MRLARASGLLSPTKKSRIERCPNDLGDTACVLLAELGIVAAQGREGIKDTPNWRIPCRKRIEHRNRGPS